MDFNLLEEQRLLKKTVEQLVADHYEFGKRKGYAQECEGWSRALWARYAELGLLGLPFAEENGGYGGGPVETMIVMEAFGRGLVLEPFLATIVLGGGFLRLGGSEAQRATLIPRIAVGQLLLAFAHTERQSRYNLADVATTARRDRNGWVLDGKKCVVLHGDVADKLIVTARVGGASRCDRDGVALFLVDATAPGMSRRGYLMQDGLRAAEISLSGVRVSPDAAIGKPGTALPLIEWVVDGALAALCAEAVGAMAAMHEMTVDYLKTRTQFGTTIGTFQVLRHRAVDMLTALEQARSMAMFAAMMAAEPDVAERRKAVAAAKVQIGQSARFVGQQAIQLHGGIGMTMQYKVGHYFKRTTMIDLMFGNADYHLRELARMGGLIAGDAPASADCVIAAAAEDAVSGAALDRPVLERARSVAAR